MLGSMSINDREMIPVSDEDLFKQPPPPMGDCPICFLRMPSLYTGYKHNACCGKVLCNGCICANAKLTDDEKCAFCRTPAPESDEELIIRLMKRIEVNDAQAIYNLGCGYDQGTYGCPKNHDKALELWHRAGELGYMKAYNNIGNSYYNGRRVEKDEKKAIYYWELAAMGGHVTARYNLGVEEYRAGNMDRALKHWTIAAEGGHKKSLISVKQLYALGHATKDDYGTALRAHQSYLDEIRSVQRDEAAEYSGDWEYY